MQSHPRYSEESFEGLSLAASNPGVFTDDDRGMITGLAEDGFFLRFLIDPLADLDAGLDERLPKDLDEEKKSIIRNFIRCLSNSAKFDKVFRLLYQSVIKKEDNPQLFFEMLRSYAKDHMRVVAGESEYFENFLGDIFRLHKEKDFTYHILLSLYNICGDISVLQHSSHNMKRFISGGGEYEIFDQEFIKYMAQRHSWLGSFLSAEADFKALDDFGKIIFIFKGFGIYSGRSKYSSVVGIPKNPDLNDALDRMGYAKEYFKKIIDGFRDKKLLAVNEDFLDDYHYKINLEHNGKVMTVPFPRDFVNLFREFCLKYLPLKDVHEVLTEWVERHLVLRDMKDRALGLDPKIEPPVKLNATGLARYLGRDFVEVNGFNIVPRFDKTEGLIYIGLPYIDAVKNSEGSITHFKIHKNFLGRNLFQCFDVERQEHIIISDNCLIARFMALFTVLQKIKPDVNFKNAAKRFLDSSYIFAEGDREIINRVFTADLLAKLEGIDPEFYPGDLDFAGATYEKLMKLVTDCYFHRNVVRNFMNRWDDVKLTGDPKSINEINVTFEKHLQKGSVVFKEIPGLEFFHVENGRTMSLSILMVNAIEFARVGRQRFIDEMEGEYEPPKPPLCSDKELDELFKKTDTKVKHKGKVRASGGASGGALPVKPQKAVAVAAPVIPEVHKKEAEEKKKILEEIRSLLKLEDIDLKRFSKGNLITCGDIKNIDDVKFLAMVFSRKKGQLRVDIDREKIDRSDLEKLQKLIDDNAQELAEEKARLLQEKAEREEAAKLLRIEKMRKKLEAEELEFEKSEKDAVKKSKELDEIYQRIRKESEDKVRDLRQKSEERLRFLESNNLFLNKISDDGEILEVRIASLRQRGLQSYLEESELDKIGRLSHSAEKIAVLQDELGHLMRIIDSSFCEDDNVVRADSELVALTGPDLEIYELEQRKKLLTKKKEYFAKQEEVRNKASKLRSDFIDFVAGADSPFKLEDEVQKQKYFLYEHEALRLRELVNDDGSLKSEVLEELRKIKEAKDPAERFAFEMQQFLSIASREWDKSSLRNFLPSTVKAIVKFIKNAFGIPGAQDYIHGGILYNSKTQDLDMQIDYPWEFLLPPRDSIADNSEFKRLFSGIKVESNPIMYKQKILAYSIKFGEFFDITLCAQSYHKTSNYISYYDGVRLGEGGFEFKEKYKNDFLEKNSKVVGDAAEYPYHEIKYLKVSNVYAHDFYLRASYQLLNNPFITPEVQAFINEKIVESLEILFIRGETEGDIEDGILKFVKNHKMSKDDEEKFRENLFTNCRLARMKISAISGPSPDPEHPSVPRSEAASRQ